MQSLINWLRTTNEWIIVLTIVGGSILLFGILLMIPLFYTWLNYLLFGRQFLKANAVALENYNKSQDAEAYYHALQAIPLSRIQQQRANHYFNLSTAAYKSGRIEEAYHYLSLADFQGEKYQEIVQEQRAYFDQHLGKLNHKE